MGVCDKIKSKPLKIKETGIPFCDYHDLKQDESGPLPQ
jgi:hypothetical protein